METVKPILDFLKTVALITTGQLIAILGVFFVFGLLLFLLARFTRNTFVKSIGYKFDVYVTGWIGTPVHELGHAIFCIPFGHRIVEMKLFSPNSGDGSLGYVNHSYNPRNVWHNIGNFFISFGPILFGSFVLYLLIKYLVPDNQGLLALVSSQKANLSSWIGLKQFFISLVSTGTNLFFQLFSRANMQSWQFWVFLYLALSISSHMELSPPDLKGVWAGLRAIIILLLIINCVAVFFHIDLSKFTAILSSYSYMTTGIFTLAIILSFMFFVVTFVLFNIYTIIRYKKMFHPFA